MHSSSPEPLTVAILGSSDTRTATTEPQEMEEVLARRLGRQVPVHDLAVPSDGVLDSFSMVDLIAFIEKEAEIKMKPGDVRLDNLDSIGCILNYVNSLKKATGPAK
jgi:acyl carrier protein